ncbi:MAG: hypothetical protein JO091_07255 [Acidobacteriaceae bacterium]|nr:hypothetical protein [Acidobacteriaceae bacterium]
MLFVIVLYAALIAVAAFGPLRWAFVAYILLCLIEFPGEKSAVGMLNLTKGIFLPLYLLWRLRAYSGHRTIIAAPVAWALLVVYAGIAAAWSFFPIAGLKMVGHLAGLLIIAFVLVRATKGGFIGPKSLLPLTIGTLALAVLRLIFEPRWADDPARFTSFAPAQGFAAFLAALFCVGLASRSIVANVRLFSCAALAIALVFNGSRIWFGGIIVATVLAIIVSGLPAWGKICGAGLITILIAVLIGGKDTILGLVSEEAPSNRIAGAITALYSGDSASSPLGTLRFRKGIDAAGIERIRSSSFGELLFGHGTSNGSVITGSLYRSYSKFSDPNRMVHNDWLRILYEWGLVGFCLWSTVIVSLVLFAWVGMRIDPSGNSKPLLVYIPVFLTAFAGENFLAGAGSAATNGLLLLIAFASISHRYVRRARVVALTDAAALHSPLPEELLSGSAR